MVGAGAIALLILVSGCSEVRKSIGKAMGRSYSSTPAVAKIKVSPATHELAKHLKNVDAKLYGTYWCPYCTRQKALFGEAIAKIQEVECDPKGDNAQPALCASANVSSYPSWTIQGKVYRGFRSLDELALLSGYQGPCNFDGLSGTPQSNPQSIPQSKK